MYWNKQVAINYWIDKDYYQVERSFDLSRVVFKLIVFFFFLSFFSLSLFLSFSGLTLFVKTTERTVTECLKFSLSRKRLTQAFRRLSATRLSYNKTIQLYYPSSCICSPRSIVNGTIDRARFGKKKKRWNIQFNRYSVHRTRIRFLS